MLLSANKSREPRVILIPSEGLSNPEQKRPRPLQSKKKNNVSATEPAKQAENKWMVQWMDEYDSLQKKLIQAEQMFRKNLNQRKQWFKKERKSLIAKNKFLHSKIKRQNFHEFRLKYRYRELKLKYANEAIAHAWSQTDCAFDNKSTQTDRQITIADQLINVASSVQSNENGTNVNNLTEMHSPRKSDASVFKTNQIIFVEHSYAESPLAEKQTSKAKKKYR